MHCLRCGYDLRGNTSKICPECGYYAHWKGFWFLDWSRCTQAMNLLRDTGIPAHVTGQGQNLLTILTGHGQSTQRFLVRVPAEYESTVQSLLDELAIQPTRPLVDVTEPNCPHCDAGLEASVKDTCPACDGMFEWIDIEALHRRTSRYRTTRTKRSAACDDFCHCCWGRS